MKQILGKGELFSDEFNQFKKLINFYPVINAAAIEAILGKMIGTPKEMVLYNQISDYLDIFGAKASLERDVKSIQTYAKMIDLVSILTLHDTRYIADRYVGLLKSQPVIPIVVQRIKNMLSTGRINDVIVTPFLQKILREELTNYINFSQKYRAETFINIAVFGNASLNYYWALEKDLTRHRDDQVSDWANANKDLLKVDFDQATDIATEPIDMEIMLESLRTDSNYELKEILDFLVFHPQSAPGGLWSQVVLDRVNEIRQEYASEKRQSAFDLRAIELIDNFLESYSTPVEL